MCARDYQAHLPKFSTWVTHVSTEISAQSMASMIRMRQLARTPGLLLGIQARPVVSSQSIRMSSSSPAASYVRQYTKVKGEPIDPEVAANAPGVQALAARLQLTGIPANTLARALVDTTSNLKFVNNAGLAKFGKTLMSFHVYEHFMVKYPDYQHRFSSILWTLIPVWHLWPRSDRCGACKRTPVPVWTAT